MQYIYPVFLKILVMLLYALPAFILVKVKKVKENAISAFSTILLYVLQPCLTIYALQKVTFSIQLIINIAICFLFAAIIMGAFLAVFFFLFKKKRQNVTYRVANVAVAFGNASFIGIPLLEMMLPDCKEAATYSIFFFLAMSALGWTVASAIITQDKKYISVKKIILNPATVSLFVAVILGVIDVCCTWKIPSPFSDMFSLLGQMATPMCMIVMGFRLGTVDLKKLFCTIEHYLVLFVKQIVFPLTAFLLLFALPIDGNLKICLYIMSTCPVAAVVQGYAELIGEGQESAADMVLLSSITCIITVPLMTMLVPFLN